MSFLSKIFATPASIEKGLDAAIKTGDKLWYTDEEKAEGRQKLTELFIKAQEATQSQNVARRYLATMTAAVWVVNVLLCWVFKITSADELATYFTDFLDITSPVFGGVMAFYFLKGITTK